MTVVGDALGIVANPHFVIEPSGFLREPLVVSDEPGAANACALASTTVSAAVAKDSAFDSAVLASDSAVAFALDSTTVSAVVAKFSAVVIAFAEETFV